MNVSRRPDSSSLLPVSPLQVEHYPGTEKAGVESVSVGTLESHVAAGRIRAPAFLKLDVQGYELEALRGCESLLHLFEYVYAELSFVPLYEGQAMAHEVIEFMTARGFRIAGVYNVFHGRKGQSIQCDCLFTPGTHVERR